MATAHDNTITFSIPGEAQIGAVGKRGAAKVGTVKASVRVGAQRGTGDLVRVTARPGEDVVVLSVTGGPTLVLHPQDARDLLQAQVAGATRSGLKAEGGANAVTVSAQLGWPGLEAGATRGATRGWMGQAVLGAIEVVTNLVKDPAADIAAAAVTRQLDGQVDEGVYQLQQESLPDSLKHHGVKLPEVQPASDGGPLLVLVHGTFVDTVSTFGKLWTMHPETVRKLFTHYKKRVYALDHPTVGVSPIANALTLVKALPRNARLHLVTHSRGGLVAEVLARACGGGELSDDELALFDGDAHEQHRADLRALVKMAQDKGVKVERVVRIACPARGTLLASKRLDAYLSVLQWGLQLAGLTVSSQLTAFLHEVARRRADPTKLPGIEAMMPDSPVVKWLNTSEEAIPGELRVVAGDLQGDSISSWVKTLLSDAFYWTDNDLVVQTRSMYGGAARESSLASPGASFLLDRGAKVTHFNYFANDRTVDAIASALLDADPADFAAIGPLSWAGKTADGTRAAKAVARSRGAPGSNVADRPAVFVLPGILGSNLKLDGKRIWLGFRFVNGLMKLAWDPKTASRIEPDGPIGSGYDDLIERLADTHQVIPFAYDWRRPIEDEARRLAVAVDAALAARHASQQPVRIIAHSMGGLVARTMQLEKPETWRRMMDREGARLLMLGTPNGGSWSPMQTLSGDDTFGNTLVAFGSLFHNGDARKMMAGLPGFIQLQAGLLDPLLGLDQATTWDELAKKDMALLRERSIWHDLSAQRSIYEWGAPPQAVLNQAVALRRRLDAQVGQLGADTQKMLLVIGHADFTPAGIEFNTDGLEYLNTPDGGDGRVTLQSALLPNVKTWKVDAAHGKLPDVTEAFAAYIDLLSHGVTTQLDAHLPVSPTARGTRSAAGNAAAAPKTLVGSRPSRGLQASQPPSSESDVLGAGTEPGRSARGQAAALSLSVYNGDLKFVRQPLMVGHYRSLILTGAEAVVDRLVAGAMTRALAVGLYPEAVGSHQVFTNQRCNPDNPLEMARPLAAVAVGLGEEGKLTARDLSFTVRQAVLAYAQRLAEGDGGVQTQFEMAATLIGSGGTGITAGSAAQAIAQGALEANLKLVDSGWPQLGHLTFVELYLERASDAWRALQQQELALQNRLKLVGKVQSGQGALRRSLDSSYRGANYDFISALTGADPKGKPHIAYKLDTKRARTELRAQRAQATLLRNLIHEASNDANADPHIGRTLFNLLVPVEIEPFLGGSTQMVIEVDQGTASIPWELLDTNLDEHDVDRKPWAIRSALIRKLQTEDLPPKVSDASPDDSVLVIGEPLCDERRYPRLYGAQREAMEVVKLLTRPGSRVAADKVHSLVDRNDAQRIINALFERSYRVVHIAGHGEEGEDGGVVLSGDRTYLGANEVRSMRTVPELVFLNCCHLAGRDAATTLAPYDRAAFAANMAEELIRCGVRCVIAAGWAVEDIPAEQFATSFYTALLGGARFIDAVGVARTAAWNANRQGNTWAAYQCYGDPEWTWRGDGEEAHRPAAPLADQFAGVASPVSLALALETIAIGSQFDDAAWTERQLDKLKFLEDEFAPLWGRMGAVAEAFGVAYAEVGAVDKAIDWYATALDAEDGSASFRAAEQHGNLVVRRAGDLHDSAAILAGIEQLERLAAVKSTIERESLLGSAYKRLTMAEERTPGRAAQAVAALEGAKRHYGASADMALKAGAHQLVFYPAKNGISCELRAAFLSKVTPALDDTQVQLVSDALHQSATESPDFWSVVGQTELLILAALAKGRLAAALPGALESLRDLKSRVPAVQKWKSVYNEAQFTLLPYIAVASATEKRAAKALLVALEQYRGLPPP